MNSLRLKWFDQWLKGYATSIADGPEIEVFVMGGGSGERDSAGRMQHGGTWRKGNSWPLEGTILTPYFLHEDGSLTTTHRSTSARPATPTTRPIRCRPSAATSRTRSPPSSASPRAAPTTSAAGTELFYCKDTLKLSLRNDVCVFQTEPLEQEVEVTGPIVAKLWVSSTAVDTDFTAKLLDCCPPNEDYPEGFDLNLCEAILRMRFRNGFEREELIEPGQVYAIEIELQPTANRFLPGHRIRLDISSSNFPLWDANPNTGEPLGRERRKQLAHNTVHHDADHPSQVILPVIPR